MAKNDQGPRNRYRHSSAESVIFSNYCKRTKYLTKIQVVHQEIINIQLTCQPADQLGFGIGLSSGVFATDFMQGPKLIDIVEENSPAEECGTIQIGDRIISINELSLDDVSADDAMQMLQDNSRRGRVNLEIEFDIADSIVPTSGTFALKLQR
jgi:C-terminal processing protease CtpA/Prc